MIWTDSPPTDAIFFSFLNPLEYSNILRCGAEVLLDSSPGLILFLTTSQVRTKDHRFESVSHLISYHMDNHLPIISAGSELCLQQPVERKL